MDLSKYLTTTSRPSVGEYMVIAFGRKGEVMRELPVDAFYECCIMDAGLAEDLSFDPNEHLRSGMTGSEIEGVLKAHGFRAMLAPHHVVNEEAMLAYYREQAAKLADFELDLCIELDITDMPTEFIKNVMENFRHISSMQGISRQSLEQAYLCAKELVRVCYPVMAELRDLKIEIHTEQTARETGE